MDEINYAKHYHTLHSAMRSSLNKAMLDDDIDTIWFETEQSIVNHICRAKCVDTGKWVYGYYVAVPDEYTHGKEINHAIFTSSCEHVCYGEYKDYGWHEVDPKTVCRCTGVLDVKDKYIFEHDIVTKEGETFGEIYYYSTRRYAGWVVVRDNHVDITFDEKMSRLEVIGNTFDNTNLMEE